MYAMPTTLAEFILLAALVWAVYRLLEPLRERIERALLRWLDPSKADVYDAEIVPKERKSSKE